MNALGQFRKFGNARCSAVTCKVLVVVVFLANAVGVCAQGVVNFVNGPTTLISAGGTAIGGATGSFYFALLTAEPGVTQPSLFQFTGTYATNAGAAGRINGGIVAVPGWNAGTSKSFMVFGWPASKGPFFNPEWLTGQVILREFGMSSIGTGVAGGFDANTGQTAPLLPIFEGSVSFGSSISVGFNIGLECLSCNPPQIVTQPQDQLATVGSNARFTVSAILTPSLACQWFCNNTPLSGATNFVLELTNVALSQDGAVYYAIVSNPWGTAMSSSATLNVSPRVRMVPGLSIAGQPGIALEFAKSDSLGNSGSWSTWLSVVLASAQEWFFDVSEASPQGFYRIVQTVGPTSTVHLHLVPTITLTGTVGAQIEVDYLDRGAPSKTWVPLATVVLTNASEFYFDTSAIGQPPRFYRLIPQ